MMHLGDITKISGFDAPPVDVVIGGSPCQGLSVAGKRAGLAGARSGLYMEQVRIVREMRERDRAAGRTGIDVRPRFMVWENVPGAFSSNKGRDFAAVLEEVIRIAEPEAPTVDVPDKGWPTWGGYRDVDGGWSVAWRVLDAQYWGVPQRRRRIALVADFAGASAHEILFNRSGVQGHPAESGTPGQGAAEDAARGAGETVYCLQDNGIDRADTAGCNGKGWRENQSYTLNTIDRPAVMVFDRAQITSPDNRSTVEPDKPCPALHTFGEVPAVCYGISSYDSNAMRSSNPHSGVYEADTSRTLDVSGGNPACNQGGICIVSVSDEISPALKAKANDPYRADMAAYGAAVDCRNGTENGEVNGTLQAKSNGGVSYNLQNVVRTDCAVRRLTPLECERLQGYPDGWTDIGDWTDSKGKMRKTSDAARYKALGNSIALPPWRWVLKRISAEYERNATMASLFDGIGGFPLIWEQLNGRGSCLWASEIEEFPIAVTRLRFGGDAP